MAQSIPALVTPEVLQWARGLDRITVEEIARKLKVDVSKIQSWENGSEYPSLVQAKALAKQYRIPFAYLYLPGTLQKTKRLEKVDYRTFGNWGPFDMSREFRWFLRDIEDRRDSMLDLYAEAEIVAKPFTTRIQTDIPEEMFAMHIREFLGLTEEIQVKF